MKSFMVVFLSLILALTGCASSQKIMKNAPIAVSNLQYYQWVGGRAETGQGTTLQFNLTAADAAKVVLTKAYFRGKIAPIKVSNTPNGWVAKANFMQTTNKKPDMVMHSDGNNEVGNEPPTIPQKFPFELAPDECVIAYSQNNTVKYFKITNVVAGKQKIYQ